MVAAARGLKKGTTVNLTAGRAHIGEPGDALEAHNATLKADVERLEAQLAAAEARAAPTWRPERAKRPLRQQWAIVVRVLLPCEPEAAGYPYSAFSGGVPLGSVAFLRGGRPSGSLLVLSGCRGVLLGLLVGEMVADNAAADGPEHGVMAGVVARRRRRRALP